MSAETPLSRAAAVARYVELQAVTLASANLTSGIDPMSPPERLDVANKYRTRQELRVGEMNRVYVYVDFEFEATEPVGDAPRSVVKLVAEFQLVYLLQGVATYPDGALEDFARLNGTYNSWPYWRELVQTVTGRVGLAGILVPVWRPQQATTPVPHRITPIAEALKPD